MGMAGTLVMRPRLIEQAFVLPSQEGSTWNLASIGLVAIGKKKFKNVESEGFGPRSMNDFGFWYS